MPVRPLDPAVFYHLHPGAQFLRPREILGPKGAAEVGDDNYVLSCPVTRARSKVVSERIHALLEKFRAGARVPDAILSCARESGGDPKGLLKTYLPVLQDLRQWNYLCTPDELPALEAAGPSMEAALDLPGYRMGRMLKRTTGSVVVEAFSQDGVRVCVKQLAGGAASGFEREKIVNEAAMLRALAGLNVPAVVAFDPQSPACSLVTSWAGEFSAREAFSGALGVGVVIDGGLAVRTAVSIARTFAEMHARGILHSDVHHNNLRFRELGRWAVIDFGLAFAEGSPAESTPLLEAVAQYLAPEQLPSHEEDHYRRPNRRSEQYSLAALLFFLLSGEQYLDFRLETTAVIAQIRTESPRLLVLRNGETNSLLDATLRRALSKDPAARFASAGDFADALEAAAIDPERAADADGGRPSRGDSGFLPACAGLLRPDRAIRCQGETFGLAACLNLGLAALGFAGLHGDPLYLDAALIWAAHARRLARVPGMFAGEVERSARRDVPLYIGAACLHDLPVAAELTLFAIDHAATGAAAVHPALEQALAGEIEQTQRWDLVSGAACLVNALAGMAGAGCADAVLENAGRLLCETLMRRLADIPAGADVAANGFGLAHGRAGALYALLRWQQVRGETAGESLRTALREFMDAALLAAAYEPTGSRAAGKRRRFGGGFVQPSLSWWCNGLSGITGLLDLANRAAPGVVDAPGLAAAAMAQALECEPSVRHVCCGHAGVALALWQTAHLTGDRTLRTLAQRSLESACGQTGGEMSLLKGDLGIALVAEAMHCDRRVSVPLFIEV